MGEHRASIKVEFSMHGHTDKVDLWINWSPDDNGVDRRITEWVAKQAEKAMDKWWNQDDRRESRRLADQEAAERAELQRLKEKYEDAHAAPNSRTAQAL